jgi:hypothetical protein
MGDIIDPLADLGTSVAASSSSSEGSGRRSPSRIEDRAFGSE